MKAIACPRALRTAVLTAAVSAHGWSVSLEPLRAQGVSTASIRGTVRAEDGSGVDGASARVLNTATGFAVASTVRLGRFLVQGLEVGGPYVITIRRLGFVPRQSEPLFLPLGEPLELQFVLAPVATPLDTITTVARAALPRVNAHGGTATTIPDSVLHRLPTLNRDLHDFVRLVPQVSMKVGRASAPAMSAGGVGDRFNGFLINGASERTIGGNVTAAFSGGRSLPLDAVAEYQVLVAPFDVRYGDFAGALVNTVTKSGTNELHGSLFAYARNDALAGHDASDTTRSPYDRLQYGFSLGGPVRRGRAHFFVASELQRLTSPAPGPYVGQPATATSPVPVAEGDVARLEQIMRDFALVAGSGGAVENSDPQRNVFARFDMALPTWNSRAAVWVNDVHTSALNFSRPTLETFQLTTTQVTQTEGNTTAAFQLHTTLRRAGGGHNELLVSHRSGQLASVPDVAQPVVRVAVPRTTGGTVAIVAGTGGAGSVIGGRNFTLQDHLTLPLGPRHVASLGFEAGRFRTSSGGVPNTLGSWMFSSLDSLRNGIAEHYEIRRVADTASAPNSASQYAAYAGDQWRVGDRISITTGIRADLLAINGHAPYNPVVDSLFQRRTDAMPRPRALLSPRLGFTWDVRGTGHDQLRGGIGVFTGRPPIAWIPPALSNYGVGIGVLRCGNQPSDFGPAPTFVPDWRAAPLACANGSGVANPRGDVDLLDPNLRMAQTLRGVLAYDRSLPGNLLATLEMLGSRNMSDFVFVNLNLGVPQAVDRRGRVLYGTIAYTGVAKAALRSDFSEVIDLRNASRSHSYQLTARLEKPFSAGVSAMAAYTYSRVRDVQTPLRINAPGITNWAGGRVVSGRHDDLSASISLNDVPHRVVLTGTYRAPWRRAPTDIAFYYVGEAGSPYTYRAWGVGTRGDLNADGSNTNDPIYVPRNAFDTTEIRFAQFIKRTEAAVDTVTVAQQQAAFENFIDGIPCLRRQRGRILERNSCREPWSHTTLASVRQSVPGAGDALEAELTVFNVLNLLRREWGRYRVAALDRSAAPPLLEHVGQTEESPRTAESIFRFDPTTPRWMTLRIESAFQLQVALRYRF